ncbi:nitroreductase family protein [Psychromicrobium xiongbiense]|uniref:nitroreductase family protein n=1 Tax=Psychromicrobium xiongbiense TaxID=3051184 RepID=UPI00255697C9|nr:nitroreductase family protein [Psychromicrobium sp. YIM S02556]
MSLTADTTVRTAQTSTPIVEVLAERWSPRSYDPSAPLDESKLVAALEAARWSPSAANTQPWRFVVARRGSAAFDTIVEHLMGFNKTWAGSAQALIVALAIPTTEDGSALTWAEYDLGQALSHLSFQAHHDGLHVHQMGGFDAEGIKKAFNLDDGLKALSVSAIGVLGSPDALPEALREREVAPRQRLALDDLILVSE